MPKIPLIKPYITEEVKELVCQVLDSGYITEGPVTAQLEEAFRQYIGCRHALAVTSCTTGLEVALRAVGLGSGDEVIVPGYTFPATANVVSIVGARTIIVDIDPQTMLIDYDALEKAITPKTRAVIPVSLFGNPLDYQRLEAIRQKYGLLMIEDAACAMGTTYQGVPVGRWADITVFSLHPRKFITSGEGGIITTEHTQWAEWMNSYKRHGIGLSHSRLMTSFDMIGTNYKLSNVLAAIALVQMKYIDELLTQRRRQATFYVDLLTGHSEISLPATTPGGQHSYQSFCLFSPQRDRVMNTLREKGIEVQIGTYALHMHRAFRDNPDCVLAGPFTGSTYAFERCLTLPLFHTLTSAEQHLVVSELFQAI